MFKTLHNLHYEQIGKEVRCIEDELPFEIPDSWEWTRLNEIRIKEIKRGKSPKYATEGDVLVFAQKCNTKYNGIDISLSKHLDSSSLKRYDDSEKMVDGDIVINSTGTGTMGRIGYYSANCNPNNYVLVPDSHVTIVRVSTILNSKFIKNTIDQYRDYFEKHGEGSTNQKELKPITIQNILIPIPPQSEQIKIIKTIDKLEPLIEKYKHAEEQLYKLNSNIKEQLKKSILQYAIEGKLIPQDPNDEPASVLLEHIRDEKNKLISEGKIKKDKNESIIYRRDNSYYEKLDNNEKCIDDQIPFEIPDNWCWARLGNIGDWKAGATPSKSNMDYYKNGSIPWLLTGDLNDGFIQEIPNKITEKALNETSVKLNPSGSILMAMYGATIGKLGILSFPATTNQACCACNLFQPFYNLYLFYFLMANKIYFVKQSEGGAQPNISREKIVKSLISVPPKREQQKIVEKIVELLDLLKL